MTDIEPIYDEDVYTFKRCKICGCRKKMSRHANVGRCCRGIVLKAMSMIASGDPQNNVNMLMKQNKLRPDYANELLRLVADGVEDLTV